MGDRRAAALSSSARAVGALVLCLFLGAACTTNRSSSKRGDASRAKTPAVAEKKSGVRGDFARFDVVEIAVERPGGEVAGAVKRAFREAAYAELIAKGYSPLALEYVDAARDDDAGSAQTFVMRSAVTEVRRSGDGGVFVTGWVGLVAPQESGGEISLFLSEVERLELPPEKGRSRADGGSATGARLAQTLLRTFPAR